MLSSSLGGYLLWNVEPGADSLHERAVESLRGAPFVVVATPYFTEELKSVAHVLLPIGSFAETSGTYVNLEGQWQSFTGAALPVGEARPGWKVLRVLGNLLGLADFEQNSSEEVRDALRSQIEKSAAPLASPTAPPVVASGDAARVEGVQLYQSDAIVRRALSLQKTREARAGRVVYGGGAPA
jgi:NADH-quinone oxidoreductase subunit G